MDEIGLYYPYFHVRDDSWLKAAALYLPQVARVRPPGYPVHDSPVAAALRAELDFLRDVDPGPWAGDVAEEFLGLVQGREPELLERYRVPPVPYAGFGREVDNPWFQDETRFAWMHTSQLAPSVYHLHPLIEYLRDIGLALNPRFDPLTGTRDDHWVGMHPHLVAVYACALANRIADANALTPVTHDPGLFALPGGWSVDQLGAALLEAGGRPAAGEPASTLYASAAVQAVVPADLEHVTVEQIVRARRTLAAEFEAFRAHVAALGEDFARLDGVEDRGILRSRLDAMVDRDLTRPAAELERGLRSLGMQPVRAVLGMKSVELPVVAALAAEAASVSPLAGAGGAVAVQLVAATRTARREAAERRTSAAGYLLGLRRELDPVGALTRVRRALRGSS